MRSGMSETPISERLEAGVVGDLASAAHEMRHTLESGKRNIGYERALELWFQIGNDLGRYGMNRIARETHSPRVSRAALIRHAAGRRRCLEGSSARRRVRALGGPG